MPKLDLYFTTGEVQCTSQWACYRSCQALARWRRASSRCVKINYTRQQAVLLAAVLPRQSGAAHAATLAFVRVSAQWAFLCCTYVIWRGWVRLRRPLRHNRPWRAMVASGSQRQPFVSEACASLTELTATERPSPGRERRAGRSVLSSPSTRVPLLGCDEVVRPRLDIVAYGGGPAD